MPIYRAAFFSLLIALVSVASPKSAVASGRLAEKTTVLLLPFGSEADVTELQEQGAAALGAVSGLKTVALGDAELAGFDAKATIECLERDGECEHLVRKVPAQWVLLLQIRRDSRHTAPDPDLRVIAKLFSTNDGSLLQIAQRLCKRCAGSERVAKLTAEIVDGVAHAELAAQATETYIHVSTTPAHAILTIDDIVVGPTGEAYRVSPGEHRIGIEQAGYRSVTQTIRVEPNQHKNMSVDLAEEGRTGSSSGPGRKILTWSTIGAGVVALGVGASWVVIDGNKNGKGNNGVHDTITLGLSSMVAGGVLLSAGLALLLTDSDGSTEMQIAASPTSEGLALGLSGHF